MSVDWRQFPSLTALRAFDATAQHGSFAGAARALNVTQAAVAQQVRALEAELGAPLAVRAGRQVELTPDGHRLARTVSNALRAIEADVESIRQAAKTRALRVSCSPYMAERVIMPRLAEFWRAYPGAEISLSPARENVDLQRDGFDLAIRAVTPLSARLVPGCDQRRLARVPGLGIAAPDLVARFGSDPAALPWLWHDGMALKLDLMRLGGLPVERLIQVPIGSANLLLEALLQGLGASLFTRGFVRDLLDQNRVVSVPLPAALDVDYIALTPVGPRHPKADAFADWVASCL